MARSPRWKVYNAAGEYRASCIDASEAACLIALLGAGATLRDGHAKQDIRWLEGTDGSAAESYDAVAVTVQRRCAAFAQQMIARHRAEDAKAAENEARRKKEEEDRLVEAAIAAGATPPDDDWLARKHGGPAR